MLASKPHKTSSWPISVRQPSYSEIIINQNVLTNSVSPFLDPEFVVTKLDGSKRFPIGKEPFAPDDDPGKLKQLNEKLKT